MAKFESAQQALNQGKKVRRKNWNQKKYYALVRMGRKSYLHSNDVKTGETIHEVFYWDDVTATDWEIEG